MGRGVSRAAGRAWGAASDWTGGWGGLGGEAKGLGGDDYEGGRGR